MADIGGRGVLTRGGLLSSTVQGRGSAPSSLRSPSTRPSITLFSRAETHPPTQHGSAALRVAAHSLRLPDAHYASPRVAEPPVRHLREGVRKLQVVPVLPRSCRCDAQPRLGQSALRPTAATRGAPGPAPRYPWPGGSHSIPVPVLGLYRCPGAMSSRLRFH